MRGKKLLKKIVYLSSIISLGLLISISYAKEDKKEKTFSRGKALFLSYSCNSCHAPDRRVVGPSFLEIYRRYGTSEKAIEKVAKLIIKPNPANWPGFAYMPPFNIPWEDAKSLARYVLIESVKDLKKSKKTKQYDEYIDLESQFH